MFRIFKEKLISDVLGSCFRWKAGDFKNELQAEQKRKHSII